MAVVETAESGEAPRATEAGRYDAFLSYAREDSEFVVDCLREKLRARGHEVWVDVDILGGAQWRERVKRGIEACKALIFVVTPSSVASDACLGELEDAVALNKLIIPVVRRDVQDRAMPAALADAEWVLLREGDDQPTGLERLVEALETDLDWRDQHTRLAGRAREWLDSHRNSSYLLRGADLRDAEAWLAQQAEHREAPTREQSEYIVRSRQSAGRRLYALSSGLALGLAVAIGLSVFALIQRSSAKHQATIATSRQLAAVSESQLPSNLNVALLLAARAYRTDTNPQTRSALLRADLFSPQLVRYLPMGGQVATLAGSRDRSTVVAGLADGRVMRQPLAAHGPSTIASLGGGVTSVGVSGDGRVVAAASGSRGVLWRAGAGASRLSCPAPQNPAAVGVSPSGRTVAVYCLASTATQTRQSVELTDGSTGALEAEHALPPNVSFAGTNVVTGGVAPGALLLPSDSALLIFGSSGPWQWRALPSWSLRGSSTGSFGAHQGWRGYSGDGRYVTVTNGVSTIPVWPTSVPTAFDPATARFTAQAPIGVAPSALTLSPHGGKLAVADSGIVYVAPVVAANRPHQSAVELPGNGSINDSIGGQTLSFLGDDSHLLSASGAMVALWNLNQLDRLATVRPSVFPSTCTGCPSALTSVSPDGREVAAVTGASAVVQALDGRHAPYSVSESGGSAFGPPVWRGTQLLLPRAGNSRPQGPASAIRVWTAVPESKWIAAATLNRDGHSVTIVDGAGNIYVENPDTGRVERRIPGPRDLAQYTAALSAGKAAIDSRNGLVAIVDRGSTYLYDLSARGILRHLPGTDASFVAFAGDRLLLQRSDGSLEVWDRRAAVLDRTLPGDQSYGDLYPVTDAGGHLVARQRSDGSTTIADLDSGTTLATLAAPAPPSQGLKLGLAFSPDGRSLVTVLQTLATDASEIIEHRLGAGTAVAAACTAAGRSLTAADWRRYVGSATPSDLACR